MFTFGREHELKCAVEYPRSEKNKRLAAATVNAVHDYLEGLVSLEEAGTTIRTSFIEGGSGVWEQAGSWLRKLDAEAPEVSEWWQELAQHNSATVRFRVACHLDDIQPPSQQAIGKQLLTDKSKKVREMADARLND